MKYEVIVYFREAVTYYLEADDPDEAEEKAEELWRSCEPCHNPGSIGSHIEECRVEPMPRELHALEHLAEAAE